MRLSKIVFCYAFVACTHLQSFAGTGDSVASPDTFRELSQRPNVLTGFLQDHGEIWSSPFRMDWKDAALWGGVVATTAVLIATDEPVYRNFRDFGNSNALVRGISPVVTQLGEFYVPFGIAAVYCLGGLAFDDDETLDTGLLAAQAMVHSGIVVQVLKHTFSRTRPFVRNGEDVWYGPRAFFTRYSDGGFSPYDSFPSGHTITAFSLATVIADRSDEFWVDAVAYSLAGLVGLSRLTEHDHWFSDVFVGAALGISIGKLVVKNHQRRIEVLPAGGTQSAGVTLRLNY
jgi:membrane-associated phospholipid phosphatase